VKVGLFGLKKDDKILIEMKGKFIKISK